MLFKEIEISGFLSYYKYTRLILSESTTVFLGQNNAGKSKLFDAFNWVLFNKIFITEKEEWLTDETRIAQTVLNNRLRNELVNGIAPKKEVHVKVRLSFVNEDGDNIRCERAYKYKMDSEKVVFIGSDFTVTTIDDVDGSVRSIQSGFEAKAVIAEYMPEKLSRYFLFQGETVSEIMSLHNRSHFANAINELARLDMYEQATIIAKNVAHRFQTQIEKELAKDEKTKNEQKLLSEQIDEVQKRIISLTEQKIDAEQGQERLQLELEGIRVKLDAFVEVAENLRRIDEVREEYKRKKSQRDNYPEKEWRNEVSESWVFYKVRDQIKNFKNFYKKLSEKGDVPPAISQSIIRISIDSNSCAICERPLNEGTNEYDIVQSKICDKDVDALGNCLHNIYSSFEIFEDRLARIPGEIDRDTREKEANELALRSLNQDLKNLEAKLQSVQGNTLDDEKKRELDNLKHQRGKLNKELTDCNLDIAKYKAKIQENTDRLEILNSKVKTLASTLGDNNLEPYLDLSEKVFNTMKTLEEKIKNTIYVDIQKKADEYFQEMTGKNKSLGGTLYLDKENSEVFTVDEEGNRIQNINQANRVSIQLAFIAGILTVASNQIGVSFPFIADAPISALGGDNKLPAIESLINAFEQSVIILKDDKMSEENNTNDPVRQLIHSSDLIENAYELYLSREEHLVDQYTIVDPIKGGR